MVSGSLRKNDIFARYGGDEFVVIFPETTLGNAAIACEKLRAVVDETPITWEGQPINVTLSIGVTCLDHSQANIDLDEFIGAADKKLYQSKQAGRNLVHT